MDTAINVLDNMMLRLNETIEFRCFFQLGENYEPIFELCCMACGVKASASAHSKIEAKENVARIILFKLAHRGYFVPPPFGLPPEYSTWREAESRLPRELFVETKVDDFIPSQVDFQYKLELFEHLDEATRASALCILERSISIEEAEDVLFEVAFLIGASVQLNELRDSRGALCMVELHCMSLLLEFEDVNGSRSSVLQEALQHIYIAILHHNPNEF